MAGVSQLKLENIQALREIFYSDKHAKTRPELARTAGLSMAAVENILKALSERGEIFSDGYAPSTGGRRSKLYQLVPDFAHIGIIFLSHLNTDFTLSAVSMDLAGEEIAQFTTSSRQDPGINTFTGFVEQLLHTDDRIRFLIVSYPGIVTEDGYVIDGDFPTMTGHNLRDVFSIPSIIENDVNLAAEGLRNLHPDEKNLAVLYQPYQDHAGAGIIINGQLLHGKSGIAGEIGRPGCADQMRLLHDDPEYLAALLLEAITAVAAPDRIAIYIPMAGRDVLLSDIPKPCQPVVDRLESFDQLETLIRTGAEAAGRMAFMRYTK